MHTIMSKHGIMERERVKKGFSIRRLAVISELNPVTIQKVESQKSSPNPGTAKKICQALGLEFDDIFEIIE